MFVFVNFWSATGDAEDGGWRERMQWCIEISVPKPHAKAPFILHVIRVSFSTLIIKKFIIPAGILPWTFSWTEVWDNILGAR